MAVNLTIGGGITIETGVRIGPLGIYPNRSTPGYQNDSGTPGVVGFFFTGNWNNPDVLAHDPNINNVEAGWIINGDPTWLVVSTDAPSQTVTSNGAQQFQSGAFYNFTGV